MANTKLLLVEDDENLAYMEKSCFEDIIGGYEVKTAVNGKEGLKVWQDFQPDVIVSDIDMPIMDGIEMVKKIREVDGKTIILFTTGLTSPKDLKAGYAAGANNYVKKPFIPEELDAHIHSLLQLKAGARSENASNQIKLGKYILDADHATLKDTQDGKQKMLTAREANIIRKTKCYRFTKRNVPKHKTKRLRYRCPPEPYSNSVRTDFFSYSNAIILESQQINTSI